MRLRNCIEPIIRDVKDSSKELEKRIYVAKCLASGYGLRLGDRVEISSCWSSSKDRPQEDPGFFSGKLELLEQERKEEKLLSKLCQPFLLNDATVICQQSLKLPVSGGHFLGNWKDKKNEEKASSPCDQVPEITTKE